MAVYDWYKVINKTEFEATELTSTEVEFILDQGRGLKTVLVTNGGNNVSIVIDDIMLMVGLNDKNPFEFEDMACYLDDNNDIWVGYLNED